MLVLLDASFRVLASGPAADATQVAALQRHFGAVPAEYVEAVGEATEIELQHGDGQYIRIWGPDGCIETDEGYRIRERIPGAIPIGDDGGGHVIFYQGGKPGAGLYHVGYGDLDGEDAVFIAPSLTELLTSAMGIETF
jgi:hypothetical protein